MRAENPTVYMVRACGSREAINEHRRVARTTAKTLRSLKQIRDICGEAIQFVPGHEMKKQHRLSVESELETVVEVLKILNLTGEY